MRPVLKTRSAGGFGTDQKPMESKTLGEFERSPTTDDTTDDEQADNCDDCADLGELPCWPCYRDCFEGQTVAGGGATVAPDTDDGPDCFSCFQCQNGEKTDTVCEEDE